MIETSFDSGAGDQTCTCVNIDIQIDVLYQLRCSDCSRTISFKIEAGHRDTPRKMWMQ